MSVEQRDRDGLVDVRDPPRQQSLQGENVTQIQSGFFDRIRA
jgi:hypothetical protein